MQELSKKDIEEMFGRKPDIVRNIVQRYRTGKGQAIFYNFDHLGEAFDFQQHCIGVIKALHTTDEYTTVNQSELCSVEISSKAERYFEYEKVTTPVANGPVQTKISWESPIVVRIGFNRSA